MRRAIELFNAHLDGHQLTPEQSRLLSDWVKQSPDNARLLVELAQIHESLDSRMCVPRVLEDLTRIDDPDTREEISDSLEVFFKRVEETSPLLAVEQEQRKPNPWVMRGGWLAAAALFAALLVHALWPGQGDLEPGAGVAPRVARQGGDADAQGLATDRGAPRPARLMATLVHVVDAQWRDGVARPPGTEVLQGDDLDLVAGVVMLQTTVGHTVVLEGPAQVVVESPQQFVLAQGKAVGRVGAHGGSLEFSTSAATIRDLGTEFGVEVSEDHRTHIVVYEGAIELAGRAGGEVVRIDAGWGRSVSGEGRVLEQFVLPHDRQFVRFDEVDLRVAGRRGDDEAQALATYYALLRSNHLAVYQDFHASSRGLERTIGLAAPPIRSVGPLVMGDDLHPESLLASGALRVETGDYVFLPIDLRPSSASSRAGLINDRGLLGKDGTEMWITWRAQLDGAMDELKQYAGLSLTLNDTDDALDTYFGRIYRRGFQGVQFNFDADDNRLKLPLDMDPTTPGEQIADPDSDVHRWIVQLKFTAGEDHVRVWIDVPPSEVATREPNFSGSRDQIEFDRIRLAVSEGADHWSFDEVMMAPSLDDLIAADTMIGNQ